MSSTQHLTRAHDRENADPQQQRATGKGGLSQQQAGGKNVGGRRRRAALADVSNSTLVGGTRQGKNVKAANVRVLRSGATHLLASQPPRMAPETLSPTERSSTRTRGRRGSSAMDIVNSPQLGDDLDISDIDVDDDEAADDVEARLHEFDVDACDVHDPQMVTEYIGDIMDHLFATQAKHQAKPDYMTRHKDISAAMREILINWLVEVHLKFKGEQETLYLCVNLIDRFLQRRAVSRKKLQLVGATALLIASKYEEIYAPEVSDFVYISANAYKREEIIRMETTILSVLSYDLTVPSARTFAERFAKVSAGLMGLQAAESRRLAFLTQYLCEITLQNYAMLKYLPSEIAAGATYLARSMLHPEEAPWSPAIQGHARHSHEEAAAIATDILAVLRAENPKYMAVRKKYASSKRDRVSTLSNSHVRL